MQRTFLLYRTLGLRHLLVTDMRNRVTGTITRKDLMGFRIEKKLLELGDPLEEEVSGSRTKTDSNGVNQKPDTVSGKLQDAENAQTALR